jgi:division protein CdvB (Snf7/Vps24/ESCRT-III family)
MSGAKVKKRRPAVPITSPAFKWVPPDSDSAALWERQRERIARMQPKATTNVAAIKRVRQA